MDNEGKDERWSHMTSGGEIVRGEVQCIQSVLKERQREQSGKYELHLWEVGVKGSGTHTHLHTKTHTKCQNVSCENCLLIGSMTYDNKFDNCLRNVFMQKCQKNTFSLFKPVPLQTCPSIY